MADVSEKTSADSKSQQVIEHLRDGRVRMTAPMQDLEAVIGLSGATVKSTDDAGHAGFQWQVLGMGRDAALAPVLWTGSVAVEGEVVSVQRPGVIEEFRVDSDGIRQDFVVPMRPQGAGELVVELVAHGASVNEVEGQDGQAVAVRMSDGRVLHYHQLHVTDAAGEKLAARMSVNERGMLRISVSDAGVAYPVRIDPTFSDADWSALARGGFGSNAQIKQIVVAGSQVFVGGSFTTADGIAANHVAVWNGSSWARLGSGVNFPVRALAWDSANGRLYVGGDFTDAGGVSANRIALWNANTSTWAALGGGMNNAVSALAYDGVSNRLYAGGEFTTAGGSAANYIAVWGGSDWAALGSGVDSAVLALAWDASNSRLYAGGRFRNAGGARANRVAAWNVNTSSWAALGDGGQGDVAALAWDAVNSRLFAGGIFSLPRPPGSLPVTRESLVSLWDGATWSNILFARFGNQRGVTTLAWDATNARLYAGGLWEETLSGPSSSVAVWDGSAPSGTAPNTSWTVLSGSLGLGVDALAWDAVNARLYASGRSSVADGASGTDVAFWNGTIWTGLGNNPIGGGRVDALAWDAENSRLFAGGQFIVTAVGATTNGVVVWNGSSWSGLGSGVNGSVRALTWDSANSRLYVGGDFTDASGVSASRVAVWNSNTSTWAALGSGMNNTVLALAYADARNRLYAAGEFTTAGGSASNYVAVWDGSDWAALGSGVDNIVRAMAFDPVNSRLYVGGRFSSAGGATANRVAVWNVNTNNWTALGSGLAGEVAALTWDAANSRLFAGGSAGGTLGTVTIWNGNNWTGTGGPSGVDLLYSADDDATVFALAWDAARERLYAGGNFIRASGSEARHVAVWNGSTWAALGSGANRNVRALAWDATNRRLYVGGEFTTAGGIPARVAQAQFGKGQTISFPNPGTQTFGTTPTLLATADSGLPVTFSSDIPSVCTITPSGTLTFVNIGTCAINADQAGDATFDAAPRVRRSFAVNPPPPTLPGPPTNALATPGNTQALVAFSAPASNGGAAITGYTVLSEPGGFIGAGVSSPIVVSGLVNGTSYTFTVRATNSVGTGAPSSPSNAVTPRAAQTITFSSPGTQSFGTTPSLTAVSDSGLTVTFTSSRTDVCTITPGGALAFVTAGTCTINADQAGNELFFPAMRVTRSFVVNPLVPAAPTIGTATAGNAQAAVTFTAPASNGGSAITVYTVTASPGAITGTGARSPVTVTGLTNGTSYTFTVTATNSAGTGAASAASNSVTPFVPTAPVVLRADRAMVRENSSAVEISVLANDSIDQALANVGVLSISTAPARGTAAVLTRGTANVLDDVIRYTPTVNASGADSLVYRVCFGGVVPCVESRLSIDVRPIALAALESDAPFDRGYIDETLSGLRALPAARFDAHGLVVPVITDAALNDASDAGAPWGAGRTVTISRALVAGSTARDWRVLVDARGTSGGDIDLYLGVDSNGNGAADASELECSSAMSISERCDLSLTAPANGTARYWVLAHSSQAGQTARFEVFETPLDVPAANRTLVATGPGALAAGESFPVRLAWSDSTFLPGQSRGGWLHVRADEGTSLGWVPVRINRTAGDPGAFALESGVDHALALRAGAAHERLYIDVPSGATQLAVTTTSASNVDLYLARVDTLAASAATPTIATAPARSLAIASAVTGSGNESLAVSNPATGRWYVTPVNASAGAATLTVRATVTAVAPQVRAGGYFNPQRSGNGLFLYPAGSELAGLWYTYLQDGTPTWYYLQAAAPGANGLWRGIIYRSAWNGSSNRLTAVGQATVTPTTTGAFTFNYSVDGETGSEAYSNFSGACPTVNGTPLDISGHWFDPLRSGTGYSVQSFPDYEFYLVFGYDTRGVPRYLVAERSGFGGTNESLALEQLRGVCPLCTRTGNPVRTTVGTLQRRIDGGTLRNITLSATYVNGVPGTWAANDAVIPLGSLRGCAEP